MHRFEQCYNKTRFLVSNYKYFRNLPGIKFDKDLSVVMGKTGPNRLHNGVLVSLRNAIRQSRRKSNHSEGEVLVAGCERGVGERIKDWWTGSNSFNLNDRVASVKMLRHLDLVKVRGGQEVWVYSPPKKYTEWLYDEYKGLGKASLEYWSDMRSEVYSKEDKKAMGEAVQIANNWCMQCLAKLGAPDTTTKAVIKRWFLGSGAGDDQVARTARELLSGFRKIAKVLNGHKLVLSDEPIDRNGGGWKDYAFVYKSEKLDVIYVQKATLDAAKGSEMWDAALTIVHELSHRELGTDDHRYGDDGGKLGPSAGSGALSEAQAITNADNWGYFSADLNGQVAASWRRYVSGVS